jgi:phosphatidylinositol alpha-1,6-mannosyltransferase
MEVSSKVLFITRNFPPLTGGMERLNQRAFMALRSRFTIAMCGPKGAGAFLPEGMICREVPLSPLSRFLIGCQWETLKLARTFEPCVVYSGSGLTAPAALIAARVTGARTVCFLHGLDVVADHLLYRNLFLPAIRRIDRVLVNSQHTASLARSAGVRPERIEIIHPGVEIPDWLGRPTARQRFRDRYELGSKPVLLAAGRLTQRKGLSEFIRHAMPAIRSELPNVQLLVVGSEPTNALKHNGGVRADIVAAIAETGMELNVSLLGSIDDASLSDAYFAADAMVFPVLDLPGDVEGFGMVAVEAAAHGLPTVAFAVGGVADSVANGESGWLIPSGEYAGMIQRILDLLKLNGERVWANNCRRHAECFAWRIFGQKLTGAVARCLEGQLVG